MYKYYFRPYLQCLITLFDSYFNFNFCRQVTITGRDFVKANNVGIFINMFDKHLVPRK